MISNNCWGSLCALAKCVDALSSYDSSEGVIVECFCMALFCGICDCGVFMRVVVWEIRDCGVFLRVVVWKIRDCGVFRGGFRRHVVFNSQESRICVRKARNKGVEGSRITYLHKESKG